jgi:type I restriction enzyme S subunit
MTSRRTWLERVPANWQVRSPKLLFVERREPSTPSDTHLTPSQHHGVVPQEEYMALSGSQVVRNLVGADNMKHVEPDDFVIHLRSFQGGIELSNHRGKVSNAYTVFSAVRDTDPAFFRWVLKSSGFIQELSTATEQLRDGQSIKFEQFARIGLPVPPLDEQRRIADFLDDQVALVDEIRARKQAQVVAAQELVAAHLEQEFSQVKVAGWEMRPIKSVCTYFRDGDWIESPFITDSGIRLIQTGNVGIGRYSEQGFRYISKETFFNLRCKDVFPGDVLISRLGSPVARACLAPDLGSQMVTSVDVVIARPTMGVRADFLVEYLSSPRHLSDADQLARGTTLQRLSRTQLGSLRVPIPGLQEQQDVVARTSIVRQQADQLGDVISDSADRLNEYRASLITAAVTGEIDVTTAGRGIPA